MPEDQIANSLRKIHEDLKTIKALLALFTLAALEDSSYAKIAKNIVRSEIGLNLDPDAKDPYA